MEVLTEIDRQEIRRDFSRLISNQLKDLIDTYGVEATAGRLGIPIKVIHRFLEKDTAGQLYMSDLPVLVYYLSGSQEIIDHLENIQKRRQFSA